MASVVNRSDGTREVRFFYPKGKRQTLYLGKATKKNAYSLKVRIEQLIYHRKTGDTIKAELAGWLSELDKEIREKLVAFDLLDSQPIAVDYTIEEWIDKYIEDRSGSKKDGTAENYRQTKRTLVTYFGPGRSLGSITEYDAESFRDWMVTSGGKVRKVEGDKPKPKKGLADNTVRRRIGRAKQFFSAAVRAKLITENPFERLASTTYGNKARQHFVSRDDAEKCIQEAPGVAWETIIALARYGGLRTPSETLSLRWIDVDLPRNRMTIHAPKKEHLAQGPTRVCPIFPELKPYLEAAHDAAPDGAVYVVEGYRGADTNLRTTFQKIITRAGLVPWPKLFQNLRASRETELLARYPIRDVAAWLGNSAPVAMEHYAMPMPESFERAITDGATGNHTTFHTTQRSAGVASDRQPQAD